MELVYLEIELFTNFPLNCSFKKSKLIIFCNDILKVQATELAAMAATTVTTTAVCTTTTTTMAVNNK